MSLRLLTSKISKNYINRNAKNSSFRLLKLRNMKA